MLNIDFNYNYNKWEVFVKIFGVSCRIIWGKLLPECFGLVIRRIKDRFIGVKQMGDCLPNLDYLVCTLFTSVYVIIIITLMYHTVKKIIIAQECSTK
jgi:hypothetical protein